MATKRTNDNDGLDVQWATQEPSDGVLSDTGTDDFAQSPQVLEVPELTPDVLRDMEERHAPDAPPEQAQLQRGEPGSYVECEVCARRVRVRRDGTLSLHKCEPKKERGNRLTNLPAPKPAPKKVRDFSIAVLSWGIEEGTAHALGRITGADPSDVPTELPDPDDMIGPPLDVIWPNIPDNAQAFIAMVADNSQLISCALAWGEWFSQLGKWTREVRAYQRNLAAQEAHSGTAQFTGADDSGYAAGRVVPFSPAQT